MANETQYQEMNCEWWTDCGVGGRQLLLSSRQSEFVGNTDHCCLLWFLSYSDFLRELKLEGFFFFFKSAITDLSMLAQLHFKAIRWNKQVL